MIVADLIKSSLRKIGALSSGEVIETARETEALSALQSMLRSWGAVSNNIFTNVIEDFTLSSGTDSYTWGVSGDIDTARPNQIIGAYITNSSGVTYPVNIISLNEYSSISDKNISGHPGILYFYPSFPLGYVKLFPIPDYPYILTLASMKPFVETASFTLATDTLSFPLYYEEPMIYNLAIRLAPEYGREVASEVAVVAKSSYMNMVTVNAANKIEGVYIRIPAVSPFGTGYDINSDSYR
ncbi:MAG: hypothetical protein ACTSQA_00425 [Candidatus Heimdallarchaeaceae archaeon]